MINQRTLSSAIGSHAVTLALLSVVCCDATAPVVISDPQQGSQYQYSVADGAHDYTVVNLNLLPDDVIAKDIEQGVNDEFEAVDRELGEVTSDTSLPEHRENRQMSLLYRGVYTPDPRFNAFIDGVMVNMVAEMKRRRMDPLYFRVHNRGVVEHVPTRRRTGRKRESTGGETSEPPSSSSSKRGDPIGGGVIRGLTQMRRFGNAEVQEAGNSTLVRSHHIFGPLEFEITFGSESGETSVRSVLPSLAAHGLIRVLEVGKNINGSRLEFLDFVIDSPADYEITLEGATKNKRYQRLSRSAIQRLVKREGRLERRLMRMFSRADKKPLMGLPGDDTTSGHSGVQESGVQGSGVQGSGVQGSGVLESGVQGSGVQGSDVQGSGHSGVQGLEAGEVNDGNIDSGLITDVQETKHWTVGKKTSMNEKKEKLKKPK